MLVDKIVELHSLAEKNLEKSRDAFQLAKFKDDSLRKRKQEVQEDLKVLEKRIVVHTEASNFLQSLIQSVCDSNLRKIEDWVNLGLQHIIYDQRIEFKIVKEIKRSVNTYSFVIIKDGVEGNKNSYGGGVLCVISLILKVLFLKITNAPTILVLDESLSFLSDTYIDNCSKFINTLVGEFGITVLLVTHQDRFRVHASTVFEAKALEGKTIFNVLDVME